MNTSSPTTETSETANTMARPDRRSHLRTAVLLAAPLLLLGGVSLTAVAQEAASGPGMHFRGGLRHRMHHMLDVAGATDAQKGQIKGVWEPLRPQLRAVGEEHAKLRQSLQQALAAPTIDPAGIEKLRRDSVQLMDRRSALITQGMVSTAQILTAEQRQKILDEVSKHKGDHHGFGAGVAQ